jgi:hydrophobic/amphiphilic exporter-1 (mainly G- bacteria), HAE1 family
VIRLSIRRPVAVAMVYAAVALLGLAAWRNLPVELLPDTSFPRLTISFTWPGASPETVEAFATAPIEAAIQQIKGVEGITSISEEGSSRIEVEFARNADMEFVRLELSERLAVVEEQLPDRVSPIQVQPYVPRAFVDEARRPFLRYTFTGPLMVEALRLHLDDVVAPEIRQIQGVADVSISGGRARLLEIELDEDRILALGLTMFQVDRRIRELDLVREAGAIRDGSREWTLTIRNRPQEADDLRRAIVAVSGGTPVRLDEVATVRDTFEEARNLFRISGSPAVEFTVVKERGVNTVRLADRVKERVEALEALGPPGTRIVLNDDASEQIRRQLTDLRNRALIAALVIFGVLLFFLRSLRTAAIVFVTIAFSILIALNLVYFGGMTLNLLTLMGLALGFGLIVDNSIVVLENIYRKWQEGGRPEEASEKGARDVILPIVASTATTLIVFMPFVYFQGELAIYYVPLAIVVGLTLLASIFVAFTFIPALTARILGKGARRGGAGTTEGLGELAGKSGAEADVLVPAYSRGRPPLYVQFYAGLLDGTLRFPWLTVLVAAVCFGASWKVFDDNVSRGTVFGGWSQPRSHILINISLPRGSDLERVDDLTRFFEERLARMPEVEEFTANVVEGSRGSTSRMVVTFPEELEYTAVPLVIEERLKAFSLGFTGATVRVFGQGPSFYGGGGGAAPNYRITVLGYNYDRLAEIAEDLGARLGRSPRVQEMDTNASARWGMDRATEFVVAIDRDGAELYDLSVQEVAFLIQSAVAGTGRTSQLRIGGEDVGYEVKLAGFRELDVHGLMDRVVQTNRGVPVPLGDLIHVRERDVLTEIRREDQQYERTVAYEFRGPRRLGDAIRDAHLEATVLPPGYSFQERTPWLISSQEQRQFTLVLLIAIGLVLMVTSALFESIRQPLVVILAVPMALIGVFLIFYFVGASFTREAYIGVIMMGGIVVNNAILLVDHINRIRTETDLALEAAVVRGTLERVRPILMTTATTVLGLLPLVLFTPTADATIWNALTYSLIGGLLSSTLFVLTTTPALYLIVERWGRRVEEVPGRIRPGGEPNLGVPAGAGA